MCKHAHPSLRGEVLWFRLSYQTRTLTTEPRWVKRQTAWKVVGGYMMKGKSTTDQKEPLQLILVVEDDEANADVLKEALTQALSCIVRQARNGIEALQAIEDIKPNLIILDYMLPVMDGLELYDRFQRMSDLSRIPALFFEREQPSEQDRGSSPSLLRKAV